MISGVTARLVQGFFALEGLGAQALKGMSQPVQLFRVLRESAARTLLVFGRVGSEQLAQHFLSTEDRYSREQIADEMQRAGLVPTLIAQYGVEPLYRETVEEQGVEEAMIPLGGSYLQLITPLQTDTPVGRFLEKRGEGLHHVAIQVADIDAALAHLEAQGVELIDREARRGGGGHRIAFVHPRGFGATLVELVEVQ